MDFNLPFTLEKEAEIEVPEKKCIVNYLSYSDKTGTVWIQEKGCCQYSFTSDGLLQKRLKVSGRVFFEIYEWVSPQAVGNRSLRILRLRGFDKIPHVVTFANKEEMEAVLKTINDTIELQHQKLNILVDKKVTFYSPVYPDGVPANLNVTRNGAIYITPLRTSIGSLLSNMKASKDVNPHSDPSDANSILMNNINDVAKTGYEIRVKLSEGRDSVLKDMQDLINKINVSTPFTVVTPTAQKKDKEEEEDDGEEDGEEVETFKEFPSIVLNEVIDGEENDEILVNAQVKVYELEGGRWSLYDAGEFHVNFMKESNEYRLVIRTGRIKLICLNMKLFKEMKPELLADKMLRFLGFFRQTKVNDPERVPTPKPLLVRFKDADDCLAAHLFIESAIQELK